MSATDFSKLGLPMHDKRVPESARTYLPSRGHTPRSIAAANFRYLSGEETEKHFPASHRGTRANNPGVVHVGNKRQLTSYHPLWSIVLPWPDDKTYGIARVEYQIDVEGTDDPKKDRKFLTPKDRGLKPYIPKCISRKHLLDQRKDLYFVEAPFKALVAANHGVLCVGVNGHAGVFERETKRGAIHPELRRYLIEGRKACLLTDADVTSNLEVRASQLSFMDVAAKEFKCKPFYTEIPDLGDAKTGIDDWFAVSGNTLAKFNALPRHQRDSKVIRLLGCALMDLTELGLAERFIEMAGEDCRHDPRIKTWYSYTQADGYRAGDVEPHRRMVDVVKTLDDEIKAAKGASIKAHMDFKKECSRKNTINAALALAAKDKRVEIDATQFDAEQDLLGVQNGVLQLSTGKLLKPSRTLMVTKRTKCNYDSKVKTPQWEKFIRRITGEQRDLASYIQEIAGACLAGRSARQEVFFLQGPGGNGKSVLMNAMNDMLADYAVTLPAKLLLKSRRDGGGEAATPFLMTLHGKRLATCSEFEDTAPIDEGMLKDLNGGDKIPGRANYGDPFEFHNTARLLIRCNPLPIVVGTGDAVWDRIKIVPFSVKIPESEQDPDFAKKLSAAESPGILAWAYRGLQRLAKRNNHFDTPRIVRELTNKLRADSDTIGLWLTECITLDPLKSASPHRELQTEVTQSHFDWRLRNGHDAIGSRRLWAKLRERLGYDPIYQGDEAKYAKGFSMRFTRTAITFQEAQTHALDDAHVRIAKLERELAEAKTNAEQAEVVAHMRHEARKNLTLLKGGKKDA
jgi:P4 family phage/plasmid primase-like protien